MRQVSGREEGEDHSPWPSLSGTGAASDAWWGGAPCAGACVSRHEQGFVRGRLGAG